MADIEDAAADQIKADSHTGTSAEAAITPLRHSIVWVNVLEAAAKTSISAPRLLSLASAGLLPPDLVDTDPAIGWVFAADALAEDFERAAQSGVVWVPNLPEDAAFVSIEWADTQPDPVTARQMVLHWCRTASPDPLEADPRLFVWWCNHAVDPAHNSPPSPVETAMRWETITGWSTALTISGIGNSVPFEGLTVQAVSASRPEGAAPADSGAEADDEPF